MDSVQVQLAYALAVAGHAGQRRKDGEDYINHCVRVAAAVESDEAKVVALLHDLLEDTDVTARMLYSFFGARTIRSVGLLTRHFVGQETYNEFIDRLIAARDPVALEVKEADLRDNLRNIGEVVGASMERKYQRALARVVEARQS